jgi:pimeloyl-ACP methyl ester carboxylesterase
MRAVAPDTEGSAERGGIRVHNARYGSGTPTVLLLPTWSLAHSRHWKLQVTYLAPPSVVGAVADSVRCPVLVMQGSDDAVRSHAQGVALAERTRGALVTLKGAGHVPHNRDPVPVNLLIRQFIDGSGR